jgi:hypothetical protein
MRCRRRGGRRRSGGKGSLPVGVPDIVVDIGCGVDLATPLSGVARKKRKKKEKQSVANEHAME